VAQDLQPRSAVAVTHFADRLTDAVERKRSQLVVGLDPVVDQLPRELRREAEAGPGRGAAVFAASAAGSSTPSPHAVAVKPQSAFFEALGSPGVRLRFEEVCAYARARTYS
jgi:orotidine-5'-phosphate decarboxylase